jgi:hypothetical protein
MDTFLISLADAVLANTHALDLPIHLYAAAGIFLVLIGAMGMPALVMLARRLRPLAIRAGLAVARRVAEAEFWRQCWRLARTGLGL